MVLGSPRTKGFRVIGKVLAVLVQLLGVSSAFLLSPISGRPPSPPRESLAVFGGPPFRELATLPSKTGLGGLGGVAW